jgi:Transglycosylase SLT domain
MAQLLDFPGLRTTTPRFRAKLVELARARNLDPDKVSAVIALESSYKPNVQNRGGAHALGLIQFYEKYFPPIAAAAGMRVTWEDLRTLTAEEQIPLVLAYFRLAGLTADSSATDYTVATFLPTQIGKPLSTVVARKGSNEYLPGTKLFLGTIYAANSELDTDVDGEITIRDLHDRIETLFWDARRKPAVQVSGDARDVEPSGWALLPLALGLTGFGVWVLLRH